MGQAAGESFRVRRVGRGEHGRPLGDTLLGQTVMHVGRCQQAEADMMVFGVVPREEDVAIGPGILDRGEPLGEGRAVLERLELRLRERVVVGDVRAGMGLGVLGRAVTLAIIRRRLQGPRAGNPTSTVPQNAAWPLSGRPDRSRGLVQRPSSASTSEFGSQCIQRNGLLPVPPDEMGSGLRHGRWQRARGHALVRQQCPDH